MNGYDRSRRARARRHSPHHAGVAACLATLLAGCAGEAGPGVRDGGPPRQEAAATAATDSVAAAERVRLGASGGARRTSPTRLVVTPARGAPIVFTDESSGGEPVRRFIYGGWFPSLMRHLVEVVEFPEGGAYLLVDALTGDVLTVDAPPVASPDGARFITASVDLVAGHRPNRIRVYRVGGAGAEIEWEETPRGWGADAPLWLDSGAIRLDRIIIDTATTPFTTRATPMHLQRDGGVWRIVP